MVKQHITQHCPSAWRAPPYKLVKPKAQHFPEKRGRGALEYGHRRAWARQTLAQSRWANELGVQIHRLV